MRGCYCAGCGGPVYGEPDINTRPCKARFRGSLAATAVNSVYYDLEPLTPADVDWVKWVLGIGWNANADGDSHAFITGVGDMGGHESVDFYLHEGDDPNIPGEDEDDEQDGEYVCYFGSYTDFCPAKTVFPLHPCCMEILIKVLTGTTDINNVDKDILFKAMVRTTGGQYSKRLGLYYGDTDPEDEEFWEEKSGLEIFYTNPVPDPGLSSFLQNAIAREDFKYPKPKVNTKGHDPFSKLPYDVVHTIIPLLPLRSITALLKASLATYQATADSALLWKQVIKWKMPWFQEAQDLTDGELLQQKDTMDLLLWLDDMTTGKLFMEGPFMSIANRRRIWGVCEQLKHEYDTLMALLEQRPLPEHVFHAEIMRFSFQTSAFVGFAALEQDPLVQQECFLDDFSKKEFLFEAYWGVEGSLIGLRLAFAGDERVWRNRSGKEASRRDTVKIESHDLISCLVFHVPQVDLLLIAHRQLESWPAHWPYPKVEGEKAKSLPKTATKGITVICRSGRKEELDNTDPGFLKHPMLIQEGHTIIGVRAEETGNGHISRLWLRTLPIVPETSARDYVLAYPFDVPGRRTRDRDGGLPDYELSELQFSRKQIIWKGDLSQHFHEHHPGMIPHEPLLWASNLTDLRNIKRISGRVAMASPSNGAESEQKLEKELIGMSVEYVDDCNERMRFIGVDQRPRTGQDGVKPNWKEDEVLHFDIDGPGGEMVTEINHFTMRSSNSISLKFAADWDQLRTNRGREMNFGPDWSADEFCRDFRAQEEHAIVGIALSFVARSGYDESSKTYGHLKACNVHPLTMACSELSRWEGE